MIFLSLDASVFNDGRFDSSAPNGSYFQNISCSQYIQSTSSLSNCFLFDKCQSSCNQPISLKCWSKYIITSMPVLNFSIFDSYVYKLCTCYFTESSSCSDGDVRLVNGSKTQEGRLEVCSNNLWGTVCGDGFNKIDGYVICKELGLGSSGELTDQ